MKPTLDEANVCEKQSRADRNRDEGQNILTEARTQGNNDSLANAATEFTTRKGFDAFKLVIEQLSQSYKTSVKVIVETIQYEPDSTHKAFQEEWTGIEGMLSVIQSEFERTIQETHAAEDAAQEAFILAERPEVAANGSRRRPVYRKVRYRTRGLRTQFHGQHQRTSTGAINSHTPRRNSGSRNSCARVRSSWLDNCQFDLEQDICS